IRAHAERRGVRYVGAVERVDDAPLPQDPLVAVGGGGRRWDPDRALQLTAPHPGDLGLRAPRHGGDPHGPALAGQCGFVEPAGQTVDVDHRFPTSRSSRCAYWALAASIFPGIHSVGHIPSVPLCSWSTWRATVTLCTSVGPSASPSTAALWI